MKAGDIVTLRSGSPGMTVVRVQEPPPACFLAGMAPEMKALIPSATVVLVAFADPDGRIQHAQFPIEALVVVETDNSVLDPNEVLRDLGRAYENGGTEAVPPIEVPDPFEDE